MVVAGADRYVVPVVDQLDAQIAGTGEEPSDIYRRARQGAGSDVAADARIRPRVVRGALSLCSRTETATLQGRFGVV